MNITYTFRHTDSSKALQEHADEKLSRLEKYCIGPSTARVIIEADGHHLISVEIDFREKAFHTVASSKGNGEDVYKILDESVAKLEKQLRRHKDRVKSH